MAFWLFRFYFILSGIILYIYSSLLCIAFMYIVTFAFIFPLGKKRSRVRYHSRSIPEFVKSQIAITTPSQIFRAYRLRLSSFASLLYWCGLISSNFTTLLKGEQIRRKERRTWHKIVLSFELLQFPPLVNYMLFLFAQLKGWMSTLLL